jgi:hypothetical protein
VIYSPVPIPCLSQPFQKTLEGLRKATANCGTVRSGICLGSCHSSQGRGEPQLLTHYPHSPSSVFWKGWDRQGMGTGE